MTTSADMVAMPFRRDERDRTDPRMGFPSKAALRRAVQAVLARHPIGEEFESDLIADLIAGHHYYCSRHGLRPVAFVKARNPRYPGAYFFKGLFPDIGWHGVSWTKCIDQRTWQLEVGAALRREVQPLMDAYREAHPSCERCGSSGRCEVDHVAPEFASVVREAMALHSEAEWDAILAQHSWLRDEEFLLPAPLAAVQYVHEVHKRCVLMSVCQACHRQNAADRRGRGERA